MSLENAAVLLGATVFAAAADWPVGPAEVTTQDGESFWGHITNEGLITISDTDDNNAEYFDDADVEGGYTTGGCVGNNSVTCLLMA